MNALYYRRKESYIFKLTLLFYKSLLLLISASIVLFLARPVHAQELVFSDTFDNDFSQWEPTRDEGQYWTIVDGQLHGIVPKGFTISELVPNDEVWNPQWQNIVYELDFTPVEGIDKNISFHFENLQNWYELHFTKGGMEILRLQEYTVPWRAYAPVRLNNGETYRFRLVLTEGHIQISINDQLVFDQVDPTFTNNYGKIGLKVGTGSIAPTHVIIDNVQVSLITEKSDRLGIERISQTDERWGQLEYDSATEWNPEDTTISRWGCALSSMVMILDHYNITAFLDGTSIDPETLNAWLKNQPDGYIGDGLLNWLAVTRLTKELSQAFLSPSLEFSVTTDNITTTLLDEIETNLRPAIINIPGHFLVAEGVVPDTDPQDFFIQDPAYTYELLSQHNAEPLSLRLFTPSFTDLSYFLFVDEDAATSLSVTKDTDPISLTSTSESLLSARNLTYLPKPNDGNYTISINGNLGESYSYQLFVYSQDGTVTQETLTGVLGPHSEMYLLSFTKENGLINLERTYSPTDLRDDLSDLNQLNDISSHFVWYELDRLALLMNTYTPDTSAITSQFTHVLSTFKQHISPQTDAYLRAKIAEL